MEHNMYCNFKAANFTLDKQEKRSSRILDLRQSNFKITLLPAARYKLIACHLKLLVSPSDTLLAQPPLFLLSPVPANRNRFLCLLSRKGLDGRSLN